MYTLTAWGSGSRAGNLVMETDVHLSPCLDFSLHSLQCLVTQSPEPTGLVSIECSPSTETKHCIASWHHYVDFTQSSVFIPSFHYTSEAGDFLWDTFSPLVCGTSSAAELSHLHYISPILEFLDISHLHFSPRLPFIVILWAFQGEEKKMRLFILPCLTRGS